jgi:hypothetical protein
MYQQWIDDMLATVKSHSHVYMIEMRKNQGKWFFLNLETKTEYLTQVLWTPSIRNAHIFLEEETVEEFKADYISPRKVSIIRMPSLDVLLTF